MDVVADVLVNLLLPCKELTDNKPPRYLHMGAHCLHRHTCNRDMAMALLSVHSFATSPAVTQRSWQPVVRILA